MMDESAMLVQEILLGLKIVIVWVAVTATLLVPTVNLQVNVWTPEDCPCNVFSLLAVIVNVDVWLLDLIDPSVKLYSPSISVAGDQVTPVICTGISLMTQDITWSFWGVTFVADGVMVGAEIIDVSVNIMDGSWMKFSRKLTKFGILQFLNLACFFKISEFRLARKYAFLASDWLNFRTISQKYQTLLLIDFGRL